MLVDDNPHDNFYHEREIKKNNKETIVITKESGLQALEYLKSEINDEEMHPNLIFLDINMPGMNGWEFLEEYNKLFEDQKSRAVIVMLTTSDNPEDETRSKSWRFVSDYITKPLTKDRLSIIIDKYFNEQV
jgi:CheY-like chemotaxis protein